MLEAQIQASRYNGARANLLLLVAFTAINLVLLVTGSNSYFLFSASVPYTLTDLAMFLCGMYPRETYTGIYANMDFADSSLYYIVLGISIVIIALYLLAYIFSKNQKVGWLIFALAFFALDTAWLLIYVGISAEIMMDILFHIWVIVSLTMGIIAYFKLKKIPTEVKTPVDPEAEEIRQDIPDSKVIRYADTAEKEKVFLSSEIYGHKIVYRRVKKTNELVIDGRVYAEYTALLEKAHLLTATLDGHTYGVGYDNRGLVYLSVDGMLTEQKTRLI